MPFDERTGICYALHGRGEPLMITLPLFASHAEIFGDDAVSTLNGYLDRLVDRYRVVLVDYPSIGGSRDIAPYALTADRVVADLLGVASAAGFDRFAYWGYSWGGAVGLQIADRSDRLTALVVGGWPPLEPPVDAMVEARSRLRDEPEPSSMRVLRRKSQYLQWETFYASIARWDAPARLPLLRCPRMVEYGALADIELAGVPIPLASTIRTRHAALERLGWVVHEVEDVGLDLAHRPELAVPPVRSFLDRVVPVPQAAGGSASK